MFKATSFLTAASDYQRDRLNRQTHTIKYKFSNIRKSYVLL